MFDTNFSHVSQSEVPSTVPEQVIVQMMHDFGLIVKLNPDCKSFQLVQQISPDTWEYKVEDCLAFIPKKLWSGGVFYTAIYTLKDNGCDITVKAPGGFTSVNHWRSIRQSEGGNTIIRITSDAKCSKTFAGFVKKFLQNSHEQLQRGFKERVQESARPGMLRRRSSWA